MADFVLVHGAWHGAWCWQRVVDRLWAAGHRAHTVSLTGVGERAHQRDNAVTAHTHIDDVLAVIACQELQGAVLVGHSYGGLVITGVADRLANTDPLSQLVYLDAVVPDPGECWSTTHSAAVQQARRLDIATTGALAPPDPSVFGLVGADHGWVARRQTHHPGGTYDDPLHFDPARAARWPRRFIDCVAPALPTMAVARQRVRSRPGWRVDELGTGHDAMVSAPEALAQCLMQGLQLT